jgi:hypothetical protein
VSFADEAVQKEMQGIGYVEMSLAGRAGAVAGDGAEIRIDLGFSDQIARPVLHAELRARTQTGVEDAADFLFAQRPVEAEREGGGGGVNQDQHHGQAAA